jgi:hypothetical protein
MSHRRRKYPYFKVQIFDPKSHTWTEKKKAFDTIGECKDFIAESLNGLQTRIVRVDSEGYHVIDA